jgi:predicted DNA-binding WGR domain protein
MRMFEFSEGTSNKFWNIELKGKTVTVTFGRIGSAGQTKPKDFPTEAAAQKEYDKLIAEKTKKGYQETTKGGAAPQAAAAPAAAPAAAKGGTARKAEAAPAPASPAASSSGATGKRRFEFSEGTSNKFWTIERSGKTVTVNFGKIGTDGQTKPKDFPNEAAAQKEYDKLIAEKTKKGYVEKK